MDTSYLNLVRGNRLSSYMGLVMEPDYAYKYGPDYSYIEIPLLGFRKDVDEDVEQKALRNQYVQVVPACAVDVKGNYRVQVEPNPALAPFGTYTPGYNIQPGSKLMVPAIWMLARKDIDINAVDYCVRLYLRA